MFRFTETLNVVHFDGTESSLEQCRVDEKGSIYSRSDLKNLKVGDLIVRNHANGNVQQYKVKHIHPSINAISHSREISVEEI
ncbi:hypothetical protein [Acinetobacter vivianii]|uniref:hypothetical protein n=1 Tax=Acinetobacter vivianii TaxID=1776742 RepID=UPI0040436D2B